MSRPPSRRAAARLAAPLLGVAVLLGAAGCSGSGDALPEDLNIVTLPPPTDGATCTDPTGDISDSVQEVTGTLAEPAGIDLTGARAELTDTDMTVTFDTNGPIASVTDPQFFVSQGVSGQDASFELRVAPTGSSGTWSVSLITWDTSSGGVRESEPTVLPAPVTVDGDQLAFTVPLDALPRIVTLVWQFGATATAPAAPPATGARTVLDDCNNMADQPAPGTTDAGSGTTTTSAAAPPTASGSLGQSFPSNDGMTVTAFQFQRPPAQLESLPTPPSEGFDLAVVQAEVCAGGTDVTIRPANFRVLTAENELWGPWDTGEHATQPAFPEAGPLPAGQCRKGWITYELPTGSVITDVVFTPDTGGTGTGTVLWGV